MRSLLTTDKTVTTAGQYAADAKSIKDVLDAQKWKYHCTLTNTTAVDLPSSFSELFVLMKITVSGETKFMTFNIPIEVLDSSSYYDFISGGYVNTSNFYFGQVRAIKTKICHSSCWGQAGGTNVTFIAVYVYYR